jgi:hypothetical protein
MDKVATAYRLATVFLSGACVGAIAYVLLS